MSGRKEYMCGSYFMPQTRVGRNIDSNIKLWHNIKHDDGLN